MVRAPGCCAWTPKFDPTIGHAWKKSENKVKQQPTYRSAPGMSQRTLHVKRTKETKRLSYSIEVLWPSL